MKSLNKMMKFIVLMLIILMQMTIISSPHAYAATTRVNLLTSDNFAVLGGSAISDSVTTSVIIGHVGLSPGGGDSITGLTCAEVTGTIYDNNGEYTGNGGGNTACRMTDSGLLIAAQNDLTTAYTDAANRSTTSTIAPALEGATLTDGVYHADSGTFSIAAAGTLTLDGQGNADSVFIFKMDSTLVTGSSSKVVLINGAQACNVYWQVGSAATLGTSTNLVGNILASSAITDNGGSTVNGRLLVKTAGAVTLSNTHVTKQTCAAGTAGGSTLSSSSTSNSSSSTGTSECIAPTITTVPIIIDSRRISPTSIFISWGPYAGINTFNVRYGLTNGNWLYNTNVTGFSTNINALPSNQPIWIQVAATNNCSIGTYGESKLVGAPSLPNTGFAPYKSNMLWYIPAGIGIALLILLVLIQRKHRFLSKS